MKSEDAIDSIAKGFADKSDKLSRCTIEFIKTLNAIRGKGISHAEIVWNAACHINIVAHDINCLVHLVALAKDKWTERTLVRMLATVMYEGCEDILELYGKSYKECAEGLGIWPFLDSDWRITRKRLSLFEKEHGQELRCLRVTAGLTRIMTPCYC